MVRKAWLRTWLEMRRLPVLRGGRREPRPGFRPRVEQLETREVPAAFAPGNLVVLRTNGTSSSATAVLLDEYTPAGALVQSIAMPTADSGSTHILTQSGSASSEGALNRSADGRFLTLVGYDVAVGTGSVASGSAPRVVGRVDANGTIDTSTLVDGYSGNNFRSAVSFDGTTFWTAGPTSSGGTHFVTLGNSGRPGSSVQVNTVNDRVVEIIGGQLYASSNTGSNTGVNAIGTGLPTTNGQAMTLLPGVNDANPFAYVLLDRDPSVPGFDTLYVADQSAGLLKYSFNGSTWTARGSVAALTGLTGVVNGTTAVLYATVGTSAGNTIVSFTDSAAFNANISPGTFTTLATAPTGQEFKGVAFTPQSVADLTIAAGGPSTGAGGVPFNYTLTASNIGATASSVTAQLTLPAGVSYVSASGSNGFTAGQSGGVVTFSGGTLGAGATATLTVTVTPTASGTVTLPAGAAVIDPGHTVNESNFNNNSSPFAVNTNVANLPDLTVGLSAPTVAVFGTPFTYTLTAANAGTAAASGVTVAFTLPAGLTYGSASVSSGFTASQSGGVVTFSGGSLAAGASATLTVTVTDPLPNPAPTFPVNVTAPAGAAAIDPSNTIAEGNENNNTSPTAVTTSVRTTALPQANSDSYIVAAGGTLTVGTASGVLANDVGSPLTIISPLTNGTPQAALPAGYVAQSQTQTPLSYTAPVVTPTAHGSVILYPDGSFSYTPNPGYSGTDSFSYTVTDAVQDNKTDLPILATFNGAPVTAGGYGSSLYPKPGSTDEFYGLEDRGPNATVASSNPAFNGNIVEPIPTYDPAIGLFKFLPDGQAVMEEYIPLEDADGNPFSGRVNSQSPTGETVVDLNGNVQPQDPNGYDSEGLVALPDGTFWVSDEYGPFITHFDVNGREMERLSPMDGVPAIDQLPVELRNRTINRGMEGLTITPDGTELVGMMQSALQQPDLSSSTNTKKLVITRFITYQLVATQTAPVGTVHEYLYLLDNPGTTGTANSELTAIDDTHFLVDERDGNFPPGAYKKLWEIDITGATDIGPNSLLIGHTVADGAVAYNNTGQDLGLTIGGKSLEKLLSTSATATTAGAKAALLNDGITPVSKGTTPFLDLGALLTTLDPTGGHFFSHDKIEGVAYINNGTQIVISNDNDFDVGGVTNSSGNDGPPYTFVGKKTPAGIPDDGEYLTVNLTRLPAVTTTATVTFTVLSKVTSQVRVSRTGPVFNRAAKTSTVGLNITNTSRASLTGGFDVVLSGLTAGITLQSASVTVKGKTTALYVRIDSAGNIIIAVPASVAAGLARGQSLPEIALVFNNVSNSRFDFATDLFSDPLGI